MFPYPSRKELDRLEIEDISNIFGSEKLFDSFIYAKDKKNVLIYHGVMEGFHITGDYEASESAISIGKDLVIPKSFWKKFDAIFAGHLHKYQGIENAIYCGAPFPLTFADHFSTGYVMWDNLSPSFIELEQKFPYETIDLGDLSKLDKKEINKIVTSVSNRDFKDIRVRIKYNDLDTHAGNIDHSKISSKFKNVKDIKIVPNYIKKDKKSLVTFDDFKHSSIVEIIDKYIDDHKYPPMVKKIAKKVETVVKETHPNEDGRGIHFKLKSLNINNFKSFAEDNDEIDFEKLDKIIGIFGRNAAGKSSLIESIMWGLFGTTPRNKHVDTVIRNGEKKCMVEVTFSSYGTDYKVIRKRGSVASLSLSYRDNGNWIDISNATSMITQKSIEKIVGTYDIFIATTYSPQNKIDHLIELKPGQRKQVILDCLQINVLEARQEAINDIKKERKEKLSQYKGRLDAFTSQVSDLLLSGPNENLKTFEELLTKEKREQVKVNGRVATLSQRVIEYEDYIREQNQMTDEISGIRDEIKEVRDTVARKVAEKDRFQGILSDKSIIDAGLERQNKAEEEIKKYSEEKVRNTDRENDKKRLMVDRVKLHKAFQENLKTLEDSRANLVRTIEGLKTIDCNRADCPINARVNKQVGERRLELDKTDDKILAIKEEYYNRENEYNDKVIDINKLIESSFYDETTYMVYMQELIKERKNKWEDLKHKISSGEDILGSLMEIIVVYEDKLKMLINKRDEIKTKRSVLATKIATIDSYKSELDKTKMDLALCNKKIDEYNSQIYNAKKDLESINDLQKKILDGQADIEEINQHIKYCNSYIEIVGKSGVLFSLVDQAVPIIEKFAQDLLTQTTNGMLSIDISSHKQLISGKTSDDVSIFFSDSKGRRDISEASGAELVLLSLALRAAMSNLLSLRMGSKVEMFVLDESLGALDNENITIAKDMLERLSKIFNRVLFISHVEEIRSCAQSTISVKSNGLKSTFEILKGGNQ